MSEVVTYPIGKHHCTISSSDAGKLTERLRLVFNYAYCGSVTVHSIIMGPRPEDVPEDWLIDHADRNKLNNVRSNLRWVSPSFNRWNSVRVNAGEDASRFRGVTRKRGMWRARGVQGAHIGAYDTEREAAIASATAYIRVYGVWAETSDLLFTNDQSSPQALLSPQELCQIKQSIMAMPAAPVTRVKGSGVSPFRNGFQVTYRSKYLAYFKDFDAALSFRKKHVASVEEHEWQAHLRNAPTRDHDGDVAIPLSDGKHGSDLMSKVDAQYWHRLTYRTKWCMGADGYVRSSKVLLHKAVMLLVDPNYVSGRETSIDHINPAAKLDNRAHNLRVATHLEQCRNKQKRAGGSSPHVGVTRRGTSWKGTFGYTTSNGQQRYNVSGKTQEDVVIALNAKRLEVHGSRAILG
jgi:hypothetical protein